MSTIDVKVPDVGVDGEVEIIEILVEKGERLDAEAPIVVLETDKATVEVPCPQAGKVAGIEVKVGDKVKEGDLLLRLKESGHSGSTENDDTEEAEETADSTTDTDAEEDVENESDAKQQDTEDGDAEQSLRSIEVPDLGGSEAVEVIEVLVAEGDEIEEEQALIVLESDKATMEIPSPAAGILQSLSVKMGDKLSEGDTIGELLTSSGQGQAPNPEKTSTKTESQSSKSTEPPADNKKQPAKAAGGLSEKQVNAAASKVHAGPAVRKLARELGADLAQIEGSGPKGRVLKDDLKAYVKTQVTRAQDGGGSAAGVPGYKLPDFSSFGEIEVEAMDKIQRITAVNMATSWLNVPHVTQFDEADITELEAFRKAQKPVAEQRGLKLTPMPFLLKACAYALRELPQFNVSLDMEQQRVIRKKYIHIGMAVDTPGGLVVPVIRDVDKKSIWDLARDCIDMAARAKERKLSPADMQGGCFTISSLGSIGGTAFTPIVNLPEVAILGVSKADTKPRFEEGGFVPRLMLPLSLSYDHRAINGADAARFTSLLARVLGDIRQLLL